MADNSIDLVVSKEAFDQLERLLAEIKKADLAIEALNTNAGKNPTTPSGGEANAAENAKIIAQMKELTAEINKQAEAATKLANARKPSSRAITQDTIDTRAFNAAETQRLQLSSQKIGLYQKLDIQYKQAIKTAQDLGAAEDKLTNGYIAAAAKAKELGAQLQAIDASVGKYGRNVGNYASGWNGLANSVNQLTREAPAFANSLNTGFMALSNNIPILADEINNLKIKNQELAASGKPTQSIFSSLATAFFSWQTVLSVGVTLLTVYGAELYDLAFGASEAEKAQTKLKDSLIDLESATSSEAIELKSLTDIVLDHNASSKDRQNAYLQIKEELPGLTSLTYEEAVATGELTKATNLQIEAIKNRALVDGYAKLIAEEQIKLEKNKTKSLESQVKWTDRLKTFMTGQGTSGITSAAVRVAEENKAIKDNIEVLNKRLEQTQKNLNSDEQSLKKYNNRTKASKDNTKAIREEIAQVEVLIKQKSFLVEELDKEIERLTTEAILNGGKPEEYARITAELQKMKAVRKGLNDLPVGGALPDSVATPEQIESVKQLTEANKEYIRSFVSEFASNSGFSETFNMLQGGIEGFGENWHTTSLAIMESAQEMFNFISNASQQNFDAEYARLESQKEIALQFAGDSESAKKKVEEDAEKRRKEIANREFKAKKQQAVFNIAMDTAQAIISIWAQVPKFDFGISATALSLMVGALGAAQIGVVAAQKVPQYFEGTDNHPGGLALINDGKGSNYKETVVTPDGKVRQFNGRDVVIDAPAGTQVFTHEQWNNELNTMMREKGISMANSFQSKSGLSYQEMDSIIAKHFSKITTQSTVIDRNGFNTFVSNGTSKTIRNQSRYSGTGFAV
jgi:hypothetical protein